MELLLVALGVLHMLLLLAPGIATLFAWDCSRSNRVRCARLARFAMIGAALSVVVWVVFVTSVGLGRLPDELWEERTWILALFQSAIFTLSWLATRGPRSSRRESADDE
jgi:4-amino-4-deoxy-L-arabinose transferase-like glycosyltransferase